jgi:hypothetical protein
LGRNGRGVSGHFSDDYGVGLHQHPAPAARLHPYYDKIGHGVLYAIAAYLGHRILRCRWLVWNSIPLPRFALLFGLFTVAEELVQSLSPHRTLDAIDLLWSFVGIALGTGMAEWQYRRPLKR